jgi:hypothetical protein
VASFLQNFQALYKFLNAFYTSCPTHFPKTDHHKRTHFVSISCLTMQAYRELKKLVLSLHINDPLTHCHVLAVPWLIIMGSGLDDYICGHRLLLSLLIIISCNSSQSIYCGGLAPFSFRCLSFLQFLNSLGVLMCPSFWTIPLLFRAYLLLHKRV